MPAPAPPSNPCLVTLQLDREQVLARAHTNHGPQRTHHGIPFNPTNTALDIMFWSLIIIIWTNGHWECIALLKCQSIRVDTDPSLSGSLIKKLNEDHACRNSENVVGYPKSQPFLFYWWKCHSCWLDKMTVCLRNIKYNFRVSIRPTKK